MNDHYSLEELKRILRLTRDETWIQDERAKLEAIEEAARRQPQLLRRCEIIDGTGWPADALFILVTGGER